MKPIIFKEYKEKIIQALEKRSITFFDQTTQKGEYLLVDNFINQPIQEQISGNLIIGGPAIPMVSIVNIRTGEIKFFAVKALLPDIEI